MTLDEAAALRNNLMREAPPDVDIYIDAERIYFTGPTGTHSLDIKVSSVERVIAHWEGYLDLQPKPESP